MNKTRDLDGLKMQALTCIEATYDKGYKDGIKDGNINNGTFAKKIREAYNNGLDNAEKAIKRVLNEPSKGGLYANEMQEIFGIKGTFAIFLTYSMSEIIERIREYDELKQHEELKKVCDDEIHVGDEIILDSKKYIVVNKTKYKYSVVIVNDTDVLVTLAENVKKTGRKYSVAEMLEELK